MRPRVAAIGGIGLASCIALLFLALFLTGPGGGRVAFADIKERVHKTRSVIYVRKLSAPGIVEETRRTMILGRYLHREEVEEKWNSGLTRHRILITDLEKGKWVELTPSEKRFVIFPTLVTLAVEGGELTGAVKSETKITPQLEADFYQQMREIPAEATTRLPERTINGKRVIGFSYEETIGPLTSKRTFWFDPTTKLPVRIEASHRSTDPTVRISDSIQSEFEFDKELDKSLFSTDPPEGYTVEAKKLYGVNDLAPTKTKDK